ncbi:hemagglutinin repeat-containing protein [Campylobacter mucosalis]|uniref:Hemagglutinin domain-containing protein n=1 Tax=Campylobacter mucosalis CCUG 21559 TaxID=1032067 RepID=A0A6G5QJM2_9BACT|nr:hemagglutinin repeat-containing protein [Campylobacter mucosalis]QCD45676.1 hemagglutinin domain-containing protein [Campylobacter mucosalis CCUG 21559]
MKHHLLPILTIIQTLANPITPDPNAPKSNQPTILKAPNETLIVNITTPKNGISMNEYIKFNTPNTGTVLNNSVSGDKTNIAGFVNANPFLNSGSANLIVNQVNSNNPSLLKGNLEIAGKRADLLIANPSGININGLNIINANSSTFTTSNVNINNAYSIVKNLDSSYLNKNGTINIIDKGLNDSSNYTNIIANTINIASNIHANNLSLKADANNDKNIVAIDSSSLGGMYANKINLIATNDGVGVNNKGIILASNIKINANGDIINSNIIKSEKSIDLISNQTITNKDKANIISNSNLNLQANEITNTNSSNIISADTINLLANQINNASSNILANDIFIKADNLNNYSLNTLQTEFSTYSNTLNLKCCGKRVFKLEANIKSIKDEIINEWKLLNKTYTDKELNTELLNRVVSQDATAYALNLQKDSHLHGTSSHPYNNIRLDEASNSIIITTRHAEDNEKTRTLYYSITKEFITPDSLANFIPSKIYSANDINFNVGTITNDKSQIYADNDIKIINANVHNIGKDLQRVVSSSLKYEWEKEEWKNKVLGTKKWVTKGGNSAHKNYTYQEDGYPAILAANNGFYASVINLNNGDINSKTNQSINIPLFKPNHIPYVKFTPIDTGYLYSTNGANMPFMLNKFDNLYKNANSLLNDRLNKKTYSQIDKSSLILAKNDIKIDAAANVFNNGALIANDIAINANNIINKDSLLIANSNVNLNADKNISLTSSAITASNINLNANDIFIDQTTNSYSSRNFTNTTLGAVSELIAKKDININANNNLNISGTNLSANNNINLQARNDLNIKTNQARESFNISGKDTTFKGIITTNQTSNLNANNINASATNINLVGANLNANESINLKADNDIQISSINDRADLTSIVTQKGFLSKKQTTTKTIKEDVVSSNLNAKNINIISNKDTTIQGANLVADNEININAKDINLNPAVYESLDYSHTSKSSWGGLKKSLDMHSLAKANLQGSSLSTSTGDINLNATNNINIISSDISSIKALNLNADNDINIIAAKEQVKEVSVHKKSSFNPLGIFTYVGTLGTNGGEIYKAQENQKGSLDGLSKLSNITANKDINIHANNAIITANIKSDQDTNIKANTASILNATNTHERYNIDKAVSVNIANIQDILKESKPKSISELKKDTSIKVRLAQATYKKAVSKTTSTKSISSNLQAKNLNITTDKDITITGADINAKEDITLHSNNGNIYISNSTDTISTDTTLKEANAALSLTVQNEYAQIAPAAIALQEAIKQLESVKKEYDKYKQEVSNLQEKLSDIKQRYKNKEVGIDYSDIEDLTDIIDNVKDEEKYYIANIALATTNVASKTAALISQSVAALNSSGTYGFSVGIAGDVKGSNTKSNTAQTTSISSNLQANNISISTNKDKDTSTNITGSNLIANNNINIDTKDLNINSSQDTYKADSKTKELSGSVKMTMYGGGGGSAGLNYSQSNLDQENITHNNSQLLAHNDININTSNDTTIKGANLRANNTLNLNTNNLILQSQRDIYQSNYKGTSLGAGIGFSGLSKTQSNQINNNTPVKPSLISKDHFVDISTIKPSSINSNFSQDKLNTINKQTILSSITANNLNINTKNNTHLKGSMIAAGSFDENGNFIDNKNLNLTTNTLTYENLSNTSYTKGISLGIGLNYALNSNNNKQNNKDNTQTDTTNTNKSNNQENNKKDKDTNQHNKISSINYTNNRNLNYTHSKTLATIGQGNINIKDKENSDDLNRLNRDTEKINKDLYNTNISSNINSTLDTRLLTKEGREQIEKEYKSMNKNMNVVASTLPDENSDNPFEAGVGYVWNLVGFASLGIIPTNENKGGILAQIPILTGTEDNSRQILLVVNEKSEKFISNKNDFISFKDSEYYKALNEQDKMKFNTNLDTLYVSKNPVEVTKDTATYQNFTNGMMNNKGEAIKNGLLQTGQWSKLNNAVELTVNYNPTYGFLGDLLESAVDKFGGTTGMAKQTGEFYSDVIDTRGNDGSNLANHSQGNALSKSGIKWKLENGGFKANNGEHTIVSFGSPINGKEMEEVVELMNKNTNNNQFIYSGAYTKQGDFVGEGLGGNSGNNGKASITDRINIFNAFKLFSDDSPHSEYVCSDYQDKGVQCGYR